MKQEDKTDAGFLLFGKKQAPLILAILLIAATLVSFLVSLKSVETSEAVSSGEPSQGQAASAGETSSEDGAAPAKTPSGPEQSSGSSAASRDEYVLPAGSSQTGGATESQQTVSSASSEDGRSTLPAHISSASEQNTAQPDDFSGSEISRQEYDSLQKGMTYEEAEAAIGGPGTLETGSDGKTKIYRWSGYGSTDFYAKLTFKSGKLTFKIQFGL